MENRPAKSKFLSLSSAWKNVQNAVGKLVTDCADFLLAVANHWISLMSGIVALVLEIRARRKKPTSNHSFVWIVYGCILVACFSAWRDERTLTEESKKANHTLEIDMHSEEASASKEISELRKNLADALAKESQAMSISSNSGQAIVGASNTITTGPTAPTYNFNGGNNQVGPNNSQQNYNFGPIQRKLNLAD